MVFSSNFILAQGTLSRMFFCLRPKNLPSEMGDVLHLAFLRVMGSKLGTTCFTGSVLRVLWVVAFAFFLVICVWRLGFFLLFF